VVIAGMETSACVESTGRCAFERQFRVTMITEAAKVSATKYVWPLFAQEVLTVGEWGKSLEE
jgi:nicotinamidase-related amidase